MRDIIDIRLNTDDEPRVVINGVDYAHCTYLLLELNGGEKCKFITATRKPKTFMERIVLNLSGWLKI